MNKSSKVGIIISRREAFLAFGAITLGLASALIGSEAEAQSAGVEPRQERREGRHERREG